MASAADAASRPLDSMITGTRFGFVGTGVMSSAIVRGLGTIGAPPKAIYVSPRNAAKAASLQSQFPQLVTVGADNQQVVDNSDVVFIGVLPKVTEETVKALRFDARHVVISLVSTATLPNLQLWCAPVAAEHVVRAIPLPPVQMQQGATVLTPKHPMALAVFEALGTPVAVDSEVEMKKMLPISALMGQFYEQQRTALEWLHGQGIAPAVAAKWIGAVFHSISFDSAKPGEHTFEHLVLEQTPGGLNEQIIRELKENGAFNALKDSLDGALARVEGRAAPNLKKRPYSSVDASSSREEMC